MPENKFNPQINISRSTSTRMWLVACCAMLAVIQSASGDSGASLIVAATALISAILAELLLTQKKYRFSKIKDGSAAASALIFALLLPNQIHPLYAALGAAFAMVVIKYSFGGLGSNWLNPALGAWLFVRFSWPQAFTGALAGTPEYLADAGSIIDQFVRGFLNKAVFVFFGTELPPGYIDLFSQRIPGIIADRAGLVLVLGTLLMTAFQISRYWLSLLYLVIFGFLVRMAGDLSGVLWNGDVLLALFSGGTLLTAFVLAADPSTGAKSVPGRAFMMIIAAAMGFVFRIYASALYGCFYAVAAVNALTPLLCRLERRLFYSQTASGGGYE